MSLHVRVRLLAVECAVMLAFVLLSVAMTWPLARNLQCAISDPGDPLFTTWVLHWDYTATIDHRNLFDAPIFGNARYSLAFSEHMYGIALLFFPLFWLGVAPLTIHNVALVLGFATS